MTVTIGKETPTTFLDKIVNEFDVMDGEWALVLHRSLSSNNRGLVVGIPKCKLLRTPGRQMR